MARDSVARTFTVATVLCIVCSVMVSVAAVSLKPMQAENKELDRKKNILAAAGLYDPKNPPETPLGELFDQRVSHELIDLETGEPAKVDEASYDPREAARKPELSDPVEPPQALPGIRRREKYAFVYRVNDQSGQLSKIVLPIYGKGLWSTLYGFIALESDAKTVGGITFYEHGETPGLGGEVDNPGWKAQWHGKEAFDDQWDVEIEVLKGKVNSDNPNAVHQIDGLSGATITTRGVSDLVQFWLGDDGFGPFLAKFRGNDNSGDTNTAADAEG
jgi:Na+-transporting NADH:ubiquinone oxidoreductase subunit C